MESNGTRNPPRLLLPPCPRREGCAFFCLLITIGALIGDPFFLYQTDLCKCSESSRESLTRERRSVPLLPMPKTDSFLAVRGAARLGTCFPAEDCTKFFFFRRDVLEGLQFYIKNMPLQHRKKRLQEQSQEAIGADIFERLLWGCDFRFLNGGFKRMFFQISYEYTCLCL